MKLEELDRQCRNFIAREQPPDAAHGLDHVRRVVRNASFISESEGADKLITLPAAWLHDCVTLAKDSPDRERSSRLAAERATDFLTRLAYPGERLPELFHAIEAHSYSAGLSPRSLEAEVVQDADRLDALGAIGIARCLLVGGRLDRPLCSRQDPFCDDRPPDDTRYALDHFYQKLLELPETMHTRSGGAEARRRAAVMRRYLDDLRREIV